MAFCGNKGYAACLQNAVNFLVGLMYKMNILGVFSISL